MNVYSGKPDDIVPGIIEKYYIDAVFVNRSYSPRGKSRDEFIMAYCDAHGVDFHSYQDFLMVEPYECEQRKVFTPYSMLWKKFLLAHPERLEIQEFDGSGTSWFVPTDRREISDIISVPYHRYWTLTLGRERIGRDFSHYDELRNLPAIDGSTRLSPYIRFGIFSVREIYAKVSSNPTLLSEIIWREFWYHIAYYFPFTYELEFQERRRSILWKTDVTSYEYEKFEK